MEPRIQNITQHVYHQYLQHKCDLPTSNPYHKVYTGSVFTLMKFGLFYRHFELVSDDHTFSHVQSTLLFPFVFFITISTKIFARREITEINILERLMIQFSISTIASKFCGLANVFGGHKTWDLIHILPRHL